jgi:hypothetical protein
MGIILELEEEEEEEKKKKNISRPWELPLIVKAISADTEIINKLCIFIYTKFVLGTRLACINSDDKSVTKFLLS